MKQPYSIGHRVDDQFFNLACDVSRFARARACVCVITLLSINEFCCVLHSQSLALSLTQSLCVLYDNKNEQLTDSNL